MLLVVFFWAVRFIEGSAIFFYDVVFDRDEKFGAYC